METFCKTKGKVTAQDTQDSHNVLREYNSVKEECEHRNSRGTSLLEVLFSIAILALLALALTTALKNSRSMVAAALQKQSAIQVANEFLEEAFSYGYTSSNLLAGTVSLGDLSMLYSMNGRTVSGTRTVEILGGSGAPEYKRITVSVNYPGGENPVLVGTIMTP